MNVKLNIVRYTVWLAGAALTYAAAYVEGKGIGGGAAVLIALGIRKFEKDVIEPWEDALNEPVDVPADAYDGAADGVDGPGI